VAFFLFVDVWLSRLRWFGHVERKDDNDWVKRSMTWEVEGIREDARKRPGGIVLRITWIVWVCPKRMYSSGINEEGKLRGQPANPGSPGEKAVKTKADHDTPMCHIPSLGKLICIISCIFCYRLEQHIAPVVTTTSIILHSTKIYNGDILVPANPDPPGKWLLKRRETDTRTTTFSAVW